MGAPGGRGGKAGDGGRRAGFQTPDPELPLPVLLFPRPAGRGCRGAEVDRTVKCVLPGCLRLLRRKIFSLWHWFSTQEYFLENEIISSSTRYETGKAIIKRDGRSYVTVRPRSMLSLERSHVGLRNTTTKHRQAWLGLTAALCPQNVAWL